MFRYTAIRAFAAHTHHAAALAQKAGHGHAFQHLCAFRSGIVDQHMVEFRA